MIVQGFRVSKLFIPKQKDTNSLQLSFVDKLRLFLVKQHVSIIALFYNSNLIMNFIHVYDKPIPSLAIERSRFVK